MFVSFNEPTLKIVVLLTFSFRPEINLKSSSIHISFWKDFNDPSIANVASSANMVLLNSFPFIFIPVISLSFKSVADKISMHKIKKIRG